MKTKRSDIGDPLRAELVKHERLGGIPRPRGDVGAWPLRGEMDDVSHRGCFILFFIRGADIQGKKRRQLKCL